MKYHDICKRIAERARDIAGVIGDYVQLWPVGDSVSMGHCPFHEDRDGCLWVNGADRTWGCHECGQGGDVFDFIADVERVEVGDAVRVLAERYRGIISTN